MPTGYTHNVKDGITFEQFVMQCARAFGATITMRDEPADAEIPEEFTPSPHHADKLRIAGERLVELNRMSQEELESEAQRAYEQEIIHIEKYRRDNQKQFDAYNRMLDEVIGWIPPTDDHKGLKEFMIDQLKKSIDFDCRDIYKDTKVERLTGEEWKMQELRKAGRDVEYHSKAWQEEVDRCKDRTKWIQDLRRSL